jgi:peptide deformylase
MSYNLVYFGNETLKSEAKEVENIDGQLIELIDTMYKVMYKSQGVGLAAPQVDVGKRLIILDIEYSDGPILTLINPVIKEFSEQIEPYDEGCLSLPGISKDIIRPSEVLVEAIDPEGNELKIEADGLLARVLQHEIDHLNGKVFIDHLDKHERDELRPILKKIKRMNR